MLKRHRFFGALVLTALVVVFAVGEDWVAFVATLSLAWNVVTHLYRTVDRFRLSVDRWRLRLSGKTVAWSTQCDFSLGELDPEASWRSARKVLEERLLRGGKQLSEQLGNCVYMLNGVTVHLMLRRWEDPTDGPQQHIRVDFPSIEGTLGTWAKRVEDDVVALLRTLESEVPHEGPLRCQTEISYNINENPYFGYFLTRADHESIARFAIDYRETVADESTLVAVRKDHLSFVVNSIDALRRLSLQFLALRAPSSG